MNVKKKVLDRSKNLTESALALIARRFKLLSEPSRLKILMALEAGERNVSQLVQATGLTQANVSRQLAALTDGGVLSRRRDGLKVIYAIADPTIFALCDAVCGSLQTGLDVRAKSLR